MIARAAEILHGGRVVVVAGSGFALALGLHPPEARGGLWDEIGPERCATPEALIRSPDVAYDAFDQYGELSAAAMTRDTSGRNLMAAVAQLEQAGMLRGTLTTTTDGLLVEAGLKRVAELNGSIRRSRCRACHAVAAIEGRWQCQPTCECGGQLRPDMVLFGEAMPRRPRQIAAQWVYGGRVLLSLGANLERPPLHRIADEMRQEGGTLIVLGEPNPAVLRRVRGLHLTGELGSSLLALVAASSR